MVALAAWLFKIVQASNSDCHCLSCLFWLAFAATAVCMVGSVVAMVGVIRNAFSCISPRDPGGSTSVLFPFIPTKETEESVLDEQMVKLAKQGEERIDDFANGPVYQSDLREDYKRQLIRMGKIVFLKIAFCKRGIKALCAQIWWSVAASGCGVVLCLITKYAA